MSAPPVEREVAETHEAKAESPVGSTRLSASSPQGVAARAPYIGARVIYYPPVAKGQPLRAVPADVGQVYPGDRVDLAWLDIYTAQWTMSFNPARRRGTDLAGIAYSEQPQVDCWSWPRRG